MNTSWKAFTKCYKMARKLAEGESFNRKACDELFDFAYKTGIDVSTDYQSYVSVEDEVYYFIF